MPRPHDADARTGGAPDGSAGRGGARPRAGGEVRAAYVAAGLRPLPGGDRREQAWSLLALEKA